MKNIFSAIISIFFISGILSCDGFSTQLISYKYISTGPNAGNYELVIEFCEEETNGGGSAVYGVLFEVYGADILSVSPQSVTSQTTGEVIDWTQTTLSSGMWGDWGNSSAPRWNVFENGVDCFTITAIVSNRVNNVIISGSTSDSQEGSNTAFRNLYGCYDDISIPEPECDIVVTSPAVVCQGEPVEITVDGACPPTNYENNFELFNGFFTTNSSNDLTDSNPCGAPPDGSKSIWLDAGNSGRRNVKSDQIFLSGACDLCFEFKYGDDPNVGACNMPDPGEEVTLEYRKNGGAWTALVTIPITTGWNQICEPLPPGAQNGNIEFRFTHIGSGPNEDTWGVDNFKISCPDPTITKSLNPPNVSSSNQGLFTVIDSLSSNSIGTINYNASLTDGNQTVSASTSVQVIECCRPTAQVSSSDICLGDSVEIIIDSNCPSEDVFEDFNSNVSCCWSSGGSHNLSQGTGCGSNDGTDVLWFESSSSGSRHIKSPTYTMSNNCEVCFEFKYGDANGGVCDLPESGEEVIFQYRENGGAWNDLSTIPLQTGWNNYCFNIPTLNLSTNVEFRFRQQNGDNNEDNWGIDNFSVDCDSDNYDLLITEGSNIITSLTNQSGENRIKVIPGSAQSYTYDIEISVAGDVFNLTESINVQDCGCDLDVQVGSVSDENCSNSLDGEIVLDISGSDTYQIDTNSTLFSNAGNVGPGQYSISSLRPGSYQIDVYDPSNQAFCSYQQTIVINPGSSPTISLIGGATCSADFQTYSVNVNVSSGIVTSSSGVVTNDSGNDWTIDNIPSGSDIVIFVTENNCLDSLEITSPNCSCPVIASPVNTGDISECEQQPIQTITPQVTVSNGISVVWYDVNGNVITNPSLDQVGSETFYAEAIESSSGCTSSSRTPVNLSIAPYPIVVTNTNAVISCANTLVNLDGTGSSTGNYTYSWSSTDGVINGASNSLVTTTSEEGTYKLVVTDISSGCADSSFVNVTVDTISPILQVNGPLEINCTNLSVDLDANGSSVGVGYSYEWLDENANVISTSLQHTVNQSGIYTFNIINNDNGCTGFERVIVSLDTISPQIDAGPDLVICNGEQVTLTATGANSYTWTNSVTNGVPFSVNETPNPGNSILVYDVIGTNPNGCSSSDQVILTVSTPFSFDIESEDVTCNGDSDGEINVTNVQGGIPPYQYQFNGVQSSYGVLGNLSGGNYSVVVYDQQGCLFSNTQVQILEPNALTANIDQIIAESCFGESNGEINLDVQGGVQPYVFNWSDPNMSGMRVQNVSSGNYSVNILDANLCEVTLTGLIVDSPSEILPTITRSTNVCEGSCEGEITVQGSNYEYSIDNGVTYQSNGQFLGLCSGKYFIKARTADYFNQGYCESDPIEVDVNTILSPIAEFSYSPYEVDINDQKIDLFNESEQATNYQWSFEGVVFSFDEDTYYGLYGEVPGGSYDICLKVSNADQNCFDTICKAVFIDGSCEVYIPNAFTPGLEDGVNDEFRVDVSCYSSFDLMIFDRWGEVLFNTLNPYEGWNGRDRKGVLYEEGVYGYKVTVKRLNGEVNKYEGKVTLIR